MTGYHIMILWNGGTGISQELTNLDWVITFLNSPDVEAFHVSNCFKCQKRELGIIDHQIALTLKIYEYLTANADFKWDGSPPEFEDKQFLGDDAAIILGEWN